MGRDTVTRSGSRSEDDMDKLINKVCTNFANQLKEELHSKIDKLDEKLNKLCESLNHINSLVQKNIKAIADVQDRFDNLEQSSKRNSVRICGFKETENENLLELLPEFISQNLNVNCSQSDIDYVFRLKKNDDTGVVPAAIILNFVSNVKRNIVYQAKKRLKNTSVAIFEDLTLPRYELLMAAKKKFGRNMAWSSTGRIYAWNATLKKKIEIKAKLDL